MPMTGSRRVDYMQVRHELLKEQSQLVESRGYIPLCPYCWREKNRVSEPTNAHHFLVKRSDVQTWNEDDKALIDDMHNLIMICVRCDQQYERTSWFAEWCVEYKTALGYDLVAWLDSLPFKIPSIRRRYVCGIREHKQTPSGDVAAGASTGGIENSGGDHRLSDGSDLPKSEPG